MATVYSTSQDPTARREIRYAPWQQMGNGSITQDMLFEDAADAWLRLVSPVEGHGGKYVAHRVRANTARSYRQYLVNLKLFFAGMKLSAIRLDHVRNYENVRVIGAEPFVRKRLPNKNVVPAPCPASARKTNYEVALLKRILRTAKLWGDEECRLHTPLTVIEPDIPRALTSEQQSHWLKVAASHKRWEMIYHYSHLAFATSMSTNEIRSLRIRDIDLDHGILTIPAAGAKNIYRHRTVRIGHSDSVAFQAILWLLDRAARLGSREPDHYLFPFRKGRFEVNPSRPMSPTGIKKE